MTENTAVSYLIPMPVVLCLLGAGLCLFFGHNARVQRVVSMVTLSAVVVIAAILLVAADRNGPQVVNIGGWPSRLGIVLVADPLSALLLLVSAVVALCVLVYSIGQGIIEFGAAATRWLERMGLGDRAKSKLEELSHGNQQRIQLAVALAHDPELLVLDEPFCGLDPIGIATMTEVVRERAAAGSASSSPATSSTSSRTSARTSSSSPRAGSSPPARSTS